MRNRNRLVLLLYSVLAILVSLVVALTVLNSKARQLESLSREISRVMTSWNRLDNRTFDILFSKYSLSGDQFPPILVDWNRDLREFDAGMQDLAANEFVRNLPAEHQEILRGATRIWEQSKPLFIYTSRQMEAIIVTGLGERIMGNGFIHTMYKMRMRGLLDENELLRVEDFLYALDRLDTSIREFDLLFRELVVSLQNASAAHLRNLRLLLAVTVPVGAVFVVSILLLTARFLRIERDRKRSARRERRRLVLDLVADSHSQQHIDRFLSNSARLSVAVRLDRPLTPILFRINGFNEFQVRFNLDEQKSLVDRLALRIEETFADRGFEACGVVYDDRSILLLANGEADEFFERRSDWFGAIRRAAEELLETSLYAAAGNTVRTPETIEDEIKDTVLPLAEYRFVQPEETLFTPAMLTRSGDQYPEYPSQDARRISDAINSAHFSAAGEIASEVIDALLSYPPGLVRSHLLHLIADIASTITRFENIHGFETPAESVDLLQWVSRCEDYRSIRREILKLLEAAEAEYRDHRDDRKNSMVQQVSSLVEKSYRQPDLSVDTIARQMGLSPSYINRIFRAATTKSIAAYINEVRLKEAESLLREESISVTAVGDEVGFTNNATFYRLFKNRFGLPPGEYRSGLLSGVTGMRE